MKFKIGDRVAAYNYDPENHALAPAHCEIKIIDNGLPCGQWLTVSIAGQRFEVHFKQCRLLKKKERRRVWVNPEIYSNSFASKNSPNSYARWIRLPGNNTMGWLEFIEVKK